MSNKEESFFGQNIREAYNVMKGLFKKEEEILFCPFCYNKLDYIDKNYRLNDKDLFEFYVKCPNCKCCGPVGDDYTEALKLWNDREDQ